MFRNANETTIKLHDACRWPDLEKVNNILRFDKEKIDAKQLDEMKTLLKTVGPIRMFLSLEEFSAETERVFARNFARLARKFDRSTKLELEIARKNLARKRLELDIARKRFCSNSLARNMPCSFLLGFAR